MDFGRDEYKMSEEQLKELANKVRVGDLTDVLRVWEQDIKVRHSLASRSITHSLLHSVQSAQQSAVP